MEERIFISRDVALDMLPEINRLMHKGLNSPGLCEFCHSDGPGDHKPDCDGERFVLAFKRGLWPNVYED